MRTIERKQIDLAFTEAHPLNREFPTKGEEWDEFEDDIAARGIQEDLVVRLVGGVYQVLRGHRRRHAGLRRKIKEAWCVVVECGEEEAFDYMWEGNLFREDVNLADEAHAVRVMTTEFGKTVRELAEKWHRSIGWIETRQGLLALGDEVMEAVRLPGRERLSVGAVEELLKVPEELRAAAVQMVLHPVFQVDALSAEQARDVLRHNLLEPAAKEQAWEAVRQKMVKAKRKELEKLCLPKTSGDLLISSKSLREAEGLRVGYEEAQGLIELSRVLPDAPQPSCGLRWLHLAVHYNVPVLVVPDDGQDGCRAIVNTRMIMDAETAVAEHGKGGNWLVVGKKRVQKSEDRDQEEEEKRVEKAKADVEAGFDTAVDVEEAPEKVIDQSVTRAVMIDFTPVRNVGLWAVSTDADPMNAPEFVPKWARDLAVEGMWTQIDAITDWVMKLKI